MDFLERHIISFTYDISSIFSHFELCQPVIFKALAHHNTRANTPVVIHNVDEFCLLFCREFVKSQQMTLATADSSSLLNMLARASSFPLAVREAAARVRDEVRNLWAHGNYQTWSWETYSRSLHILEDLVVLLPNHQDLARRIQHMKQA